MTTSTTTEKPSKVIDRYGRNALMFIAVNCVVAVIAMGWYTVQLFNIASLSTREWVYTVVLTLIISVAFPFMRYAGRRRVVDQSEPAFVVMYLLLPLPVTFVAASIGSAISQATMFLWPKTIRTTLSPIRWAFNSSHYTNALLLGHLTVLVVDSFATRWVALITGMTVFALADFGLVAIVLHLVTGESMRAILAEGWKEMAVNSISLVPFGYATAVLVNEQGWVALMMLAPFLYFLKSQWDHSLLMDSRLELEVMYDAISSANNAQTVAEAKNAIVAAAEKVVGVQSVAIHFQEQPAELLRTSVQLPDGTWLTVELEDDSMCDMAQVQSTLTALSDIAGTVLHNALLQEQILHQATHDTLTGLPNRILFEERVRAAIASSRRHKRLSAVLFFDLHGFKPINDDYGHDAGDTVLKQIGQRLDKSVRSEDIVARLGGDEFVVLVAEATSHEEIEQVASRLSSEFTKPFTLNTGEQVSLSADVGCAVYPDDGDSPQILLEKADKAMYAAKQEAYANTSSKRR